MLLILLICLTPFSADKVEIVKMEDMSVVHLLGHVVIEDEKTRITCEEARLYEVENYVILREDVLITDVHGQIASDDAVYYFGEKEGFLSGGVVLTTADEVIHADSLYYDGIDAIVEMSGSVQIEDKKNDMIAYGGHGGYDLTSDKGSLVQDPHLDIMREGHDPMKVRAREFQLHTNENEFYGFDSVIAVIDSITIYCDTFSFNLKEEQGSMVKPVVIDKKNELRGATGKFIMKEKSIESFTVENGWSRYYTESGSRNIVEGGMISIMFREGTAVKIVVEGDPRGELRLKKGEEDAGD
jgi:lipopolysaccharide assembly outer membrane protein LptD (OstA)